jgi:hypothetical protein
VKSTLLILGAIFLTVMTACSPNDNTINNDSEYGDQTQAGKDFVDNDMRNVTNDWDNEVERSSDQLLNAPHQTSNNSPSMGQEVDKIREVIKSETNYESGMIWHNGNTIHVTIRDKGTIKSDEDRKREKKRIEGLITKAVPQYKINVKLKK